MAALNPGVVPGLDERQAQALKQAGVDTIEKLAVIDPDAVAKQTGLSADDLRRLKEQAHAAALRSVRPRRRSRSMTIAWVMLALIVIAAVSVLYAIRTRQGVGARLAQEEQKLAIASARVASDALGHVNAALSDVTAQNWGQTQNDLNQAGEDITLLEQIAPRSMKRAVQDARAGLGSAQEAVGRQDTAATERIEGLKDTLNQIAMGTGG